jgi:MFS family permease
MMGALTDRFGPRAVSSTGAALALLGTLPLVLFGGSSLPMSALCVALFVRGAGMGSISIPSITSAYASVPRPMIPVATTAINIVQRLGGPVATTGLAIFLHSRMTGSSQAFVATFWLLCAINILTVLAALRLPTHAWSTAP